MNIPFEYRTTLLTLARLTIAEELGISFGIKKSGLDLSNDLFKEKLGAFVTLHKKGQLRGCIGYITGIKDLVSTIEDMARSAAFKDPRFPALSTHEFSDIDIEISVLSPISVVESVDEIEVGRDGLIISSGYHSGLLLPQVPVEQGWERETFLQHTCLKAGLPPDSWKRANTTIEKFSATVFGEKD